MTTIEERVGRLESVLEQFMVQTSRAITHLDMTAARLEHTVEEMRIQTEEMRAQTEAMRVQTEAMRVQADKDREEARRDREDARRERRELARQLGDISNRLGTIVEDIIAPSLRRMAVEVFDCGEIVRFAPRLEQRHPLTNQRREFDVIVVGTKAVLFNETKATVKPEYAREFAEFLQRGEFFEYFPEYAGRPLIPVFSSLSIPDDIVSYLTRQRIFAVALGDEMMQVLNLDEVRASSTS